MTSAIKTILDEFNVLCDRCGEALKEQLICLLRDNAEESNVVALRWVQYSPHFQGGERCEFGLQMAPLFLDGGADDWEPYYHEPLSQLAREADDILRSVHPEVLWRLFGNHAEVTLRGTTFSVSLYTEHE